MQPFGCARRAGPRGDTAVLASCATPRWRLERIAMSAPRDFQSLLLALQTYWAERGCALLQGYDLEVGAGTMNPATFLRVLGPEPWNVAYIEPSRRPADGRFGENPNRLHQHHQFQVILKPSPKEVQEV